MSQIPLNVCSGGLLETLKQFLLSIHQEEGSLQEAPCFRSWALPPFQYLLSLEKLPPIPRAKPPPLPHPPRLHSLPWEHLEPRKGHTPPSWGSRKQLSQGLSQPLLISHWVHLTQVLLPAKPSGQSPFMQPTRPPPAQPSFCAGTPHCTESAPPSTGNHLVRHEC